MVLHPTQKAFVHCTTPYKAFVAGRGSGKSYCGAYDYLTHCLPKTVGLVVSPCYDDQTEVLTESRGWQLFRNLQLGDAVATLQDGKRLEYHIPEEWFVHPYNGELVCLSGQEFDLAMTPNHRCWVRFKGGEWGIKTAEELYGKWDYRFKKTAEWVDSQYAESEILYYEYLGFWFAEGCAQASNGKHRVTVTQAKYCDYAEKLVANFAQHVRSDGKYGKYARSNGGFNYTIHSQWLAKEFVKYGKSKTKYIPLWIKRADKSLLRAFLRGFIAGDGHAKVGTHDQTSMVTRSERLADDLQEIAFKAGFSACKSYHNHGMYYVCIRTEKKHEPKTKPKHWSKRNYCGYVYCVKVPGGLVYVRRNGKPVWCGNTYKMLEDSTQRTFIEMATKLGMWNERKFRKTSNTAILNNGHEVLFRSGEDPNKLRGSTVQRIWADECSLLKESVYSIAIACLRWPDADTLVFSGTFTPSGKDHWTYRVFGDQGNPNVELFHCSTKDNPFLPAQFYDQLLLQYGKGEGGLLRAKQELEGEFVCVEGAEWPNDWFGPDIWFDDFHQDDYAIRAVMLDSSKGIGGKSGDYACFTKIAWSHGALWVEFIMSNRWNASEMASMAVEIQREFRAHYFGVESEFGGHVLVDDIENRAAAASPPVLVPLVSVPTAGIQKDVRIRRITPYLARKMIRFRNTEDTRLGLTQFESWPHSTHDDAPDSLEGGIRILNESGVV